MLAFYAALGLGCLAKGPVIFLHVALAIGAFAYCFRRWPRAAVTWHLIGVLIWAAIVPETGTDPAQKAGWDGSRPDVGAYS